MEFKSVREDARQRDFRERLCFPPCSSVYPVVIAFRFTKGGIEDDRETIGYVCLKYAISFTLSQSSDAVV